MVNRDALLFTDFVVMSDSESDGAVTNGFTYWGSIRIMFIHYSKYRFEASNK